MPYIKAVFLGGCTSPLAGDGRSYLLALAVSTIEAVRLRSREIKALPENKALRTVDTQTLHTDTLVL